MAQIKMHESKDMAADGAFSFTINTASDTSAVALSDMLRTFCVAIPHISSAFTSSVVLLGVTWRAKSFYHGTKHGQRASSSGTLPQNLSIWDEPGTRSAERRH
jgi:hypothetical protein